MSGCVSLNEAQPFFDIYLMSYLPESRNSAIFALSKSTKRDAPIWDGIQEEDRNHFSRVPRPVRSPFVKQLSNMMMEKFILNRPNDFLSFSRKKIIGISLKWLILLMACAILLRMVCFVIYMSQGVNPMELTKFGGDPTNYIDHASWGILVKLMVIAPLLEEVMFRLGLSFKRKTVALWAGLLPLVCIFYLYHCRVWYILLGLVGLGVLLFWLIDHFTTDDQWKTWRKKYIIPAMWFSAISFGLVHLRAFTVLNWQVLPFALATILIPMAGGCAITYARVNLGFWWGLLLHCIINIPPVLMIVSAM